MNEDLNTKNKGMYSDDKEQPNWLILYIFLISIIVIISM